MRQAPLLAPRRVLLVGLLLVVLLLVVLLLVGLLLLVVQPQPLPRTQVALLPFRPLLVPLLPVLVPLLVSPLLHMDSQHLALPLLPAAAAAAAAAVPALVQRKG